MDIFNSLYELFVDVRNVKYDYSIEVDIPEKYTAINHRIKQKIVVANVKISQRRNIPYCKQLGVRCFPCLVKRK